MLRLETCACRSCGPPPPESAPEEFPPYRVVDCPSCGLRFLSPRGRQEEAGRISGETSYWDGGGPERGSADYAALEPLLVETSVRRFRLPPAARRVRFYANPGSMPTPGRRGDRERAVA